MFTDVFPYHSKKVLSYEILRVCGIPSLVFEYEKWLISLMSDTFKIDLEIFLARQWSGECYEAILDE